MKRRRNLEKESTVSAHRRESFSVLIYGELLTMKRAPDKDHPIRIRRRLGGGDE